LVFHFSHLIHVISFHYICGFCLHSYGFHGGKPKILCWMSRGEWDNIILHSYFASRLHGWMSCW
jgi:hypothetical protein